MNGRIFSIEYCRAAYTFISDAIDKWSIVNCLLSEPNSIGVCGCYSNSVVEGNLLESNTIYFNRFCNLVETISVVDNNGWIGDTQIFIGVQQWQLCTISDAIQSSLV